MSDDVPLSTPLTAAHRALGARMAPFAGYAMPIQYADGILKEHLWTRSQAGAFDVSHMGPAFLELAAPTGDATADHRAVARLIEPLVSGDIAGLKPGQIRYTLLLAPDGGMLDDLMIGRPADPAEQGRLYVVVNAATKDADFAAIAEAAGDAARLVRADEGALVALQGPAAVEALAALVPGVTALAFMTWRRFDFAGAPLVVARCGYTGEDGFEILVPAEAAPALWSRLLADPRVRPVGLGARDSLRLEAGLPLYGHDADPSVSPIEAGLAFAVSRKRLQAGTLRGGPRLSAELAGGLMRRRVGLRVLEGAPAREGADIAEPGGPVVGRVTSGGFSPSLGFPIAMGYLPPRLAEPDTTVEVVVRGTARPARVVSMPFTPHRYHRHS